MGGMMELPSIQQPTGSLSTQQRAGALGGYMGEVPGGTPLTGHRPPGLRIDNDNGAASPLPGITHNPGPLTSAQQRLNWGAFVPSPLPPLPSGNSNYSIMNDLVLSPGPLTTSGPATKGMFSPGAGPSVGMPGGPGAFSPVNTAAYGPDATTTTFTVTPIRPPSVPFGQLPTPQATVVAVT